MGNGLGKETKCVEFEKWVGHGKVGRVRQQSGLGQEKKCVGYGQWVTEGYEAGWYRKWVGHDKGLGMEKWVK